MKRGMEPFLVLNRSISSKSVVIETRQKPVWTHQSFLLMLLTFDVVNS